MIERQRRMLRAGIHRAPRRVRSRHERRAIAGEQRIVGDGDDPAARITVRIAEGIELLEVDVAGRRSPHRARGAPPRPAIPRHE